ncbi:MAG: tRNA (cytidine(34)-2'-O)-methyltransferase [Alphaproteobacteria bacterium]|nr:tRNA (cytidine(34)-2'-O)-methyltransferase [Alphaproteobacteria bacterium]
MPLALALYQPDIAQNTGTLIRTGACLGVAVHIIHPAGFAFSSAAYRRSAMDYGSFAELIEHAGYADFDTWRKNAGRRLILLTTRGNTPPEAVRFTETDVILLGRETAGVPEEVAATADQQVRIPMRAQVRSLNVAIAGALVLSEALRQTGHWKTLT